MSGRVCSKHSSAQTASERLEIQVGKGKMGGRRRSSPESSLPDTGRPRRPIIHAKEHARDPTIAVAAAASGTSCHLLPVLTVALAVAAPDGSLIVRPYCIHARLPSTSVMLTDGHVIFDVAAPPVAAAVCAPFETDLRQTYTCTLPRRYAGIGIRTASKRARGTALRRVDPSLLSLRRSTKSRTGSGAGSRFRAAPAMCAMSSSTMNV